MMRRGDPPFEHPGPAPAIVVLGGAVLQCQPLLKQLECLHMLPESLFYWEMPILPFYPQKRDFLGRSLDFTSLSGENGFQKDLNYFLPFLKIFLHGVTPYNDVIDVLQMFQSFTLFQCILD